MAKRKTIDEIASEEEVLVGQTIPGEEEVIPPAPVDRTFVLDEVNFCSIGDEILNLTNPLLVIKNDSELIRIAETLVKTKKIKEIIK
ncbi:MULTISPECIES: hypothetical protein [Bacteria]|uniref:hypothetical protein n=1 Tax=Bacteria TaxID=2 RepID=UPI002E7AF0AA|nr:hypothetical protein [Cetobacterium somerae]WVJ03012.1 hypothetical protein VSU16_14880 [Cetobacterium somerae]